ncbi:hypothetical protein PMAYCL1PPCAC_28524, partial [Pristionchus mayeri]
TMVPSFPVSQNEALLVEWRKTLDNEVVGSPFDPVEIPEETLVSRIFKSLRESAELYPGKPAMIDSSNQDHFLTYEQIHDQSLSLAAFLHSRGFGVGGIATTVLFNCVELPVIHLGIWAAGGIFTGTTAAFKHHETTFQLRDSKAPILFTSEALLEMSLKAIDDCPIVEGRTVICIRSSSSPLPEGILDWNDVIAFAPLKELTSVSLDDPCFMSYSSGTTGLPKGVTHSHRSYHSSIEILKTHFLREIYPVLGVRDVNWREEYQIIAPTCFHMLGFGILNWWLLAGCPIIIMPTIDDNIYPQLLTKYKPRYLFVTPALFAFLAKHPLGKAACLDSVQLILSSGAVLSKALCDEFFVHHPTVKYIVQGYGMTETGYSHLPLLLHEGASASSGVVAPNYLQKIVVPGTSQPCKRGEIGEILVKGPGLTVSYRNQEKLFKELFNDEGWLLSGDVGYMDEEGFIYIVDRMKEMIKVNVAHISVQLAPAELEGILLSNRKVKDVAVIGVPHEDGGELIRAFVVKADEELGEEEVKQIVANKLADYKRISGGVRFVDSIPRSATGKILRRELRERC